MYIAIKLRLKFIVNTVYIIVASEILLSIFKKNEVEYRKMCILFYNVLFEARKKLYSTVYIYMRYKWYRILIVLRCIDLKYALSYYVNVLLLYMLHCFKRG